MLNLNDFFYFVQVVERGGFTAAGYLADIKDFAAMNKVYEDVMPDPKPARTTIQPAGLLNNARIEIAALTHSHRPPTASRLARPPPPGAHADADQRESADTADAVVGRKCHCP